MIFHPQGRNIWKVTKILPKLSTSDMLESMVTSTTQYNENNPIYRDGSQYNYIIPCNPNNIGNIIGQNGKNINSLINYIQKNRLNKPFGSMPNHIDPEVQTFKSLKPYNNYNESVIEKIIPKTKYDLHYCETIDFYRNYIEGHR